MAYPKGAPLPITLTYDATPLKGMGDPVPYELKAPVPTGALPGGTARADAIAALTPVAVADATDAASAAALANANKATLNAVIAALKTPAS